MNKKVLHIIFVLVPLFSIAQKDKASTWEEEKDFLKYRKGEKYKGPENWSGSYPADMHQNENVSTTPGSGGSSGNQGIQYNPQQIQRDRQKRYSGFDRGGSRGTLPFDPEVEEPLPPDLPDIDAPDVDLPDVDLPDVDAPTISPAVWKALLFILIFAVLFIIAYLLIRNRKPPNKKIVVDVENDWNPEVISKTELELRLEEAMQKGDYRECVRIYFTFILKELLRKSWISWRKEKTNYHYVLEMHKRPGASAFNECVRIYDLVWYGQYQIDAEIFELLLPTLEAYYKSLNPKNE